MSIVRWGYKGSELYIYDVSDTEHVCCGCCFNDPEEYDHGGYLGQVWIRGSFVCKTYDEMIEHVERHIEADHSVPDYVINELERRRDLLCLPKVPGEQT